MAFTMTEINCPVCDAVAQDVTVENFDGKTINCAICGEYDVSGTVFDTGMLEILDRSSRLSALERAKRAAPQGKRPIILSANI